MLQGSMGDCISGMYKSRKCSNTDWSHLDANCLAESPELPEEDSCEDETLVAPNRSGSNVGMPSINLSPARPASAHRQSIGDIKQDYRRLPGLNIELLLGHMKE